MVNTFKYLFLKPFFKKPGNDRAARRQLLVVAAVCSGVLLLFPDVRFALWRLLEYPVHYKEYKHFGIALPGSYSVHGIDVSRYQERIDWDRVRRMQVGKVQMQFAFIKATEGSWLKDPYFNYNWKQAHRQGLIRGAYHYFLPDISAKDQARHFIRTVKLRSGDLPPVVDVEEQRGMRSEQVRAFTLQFLQMLEKHYGVKPVLYTNLQFFKDHFADEPAFADYTKWIAHYRTPRLVMPGDHTWHFWQHNDAGRVNGINSTVDFNVFNGSLQDLNKLRIP